MKLFHTLVTAATLLTTVLGDCNPLKSDDCDADTALAGSFKEDFTSKSKYFDELNSTGLEYTDDGVEFNLEKRFDNPSIKSNFYIMFGKVEVVMKAATGQGIVSSFYLQSDDLDEIDIELFGTDTTQFQSNFFSKGDTTTYSRGGYHNTPSDPTDNYLTYTLDWSSDQLTWAVNGDVVRTLYSDDSQGYPQTPMSIYAGVWAGGDPSNAEGTIEWAGGETTYGPTYTMHIKSVIVTDYSTGTEYKYSDKTGNWTSIEAVDGLVNGRVKQAKSDFEKLLDEDSDSTSSSSSSTETSSTKTSSKKTSTTSTSTKTTSTSKTTSKTLTTTSNTFARSEYVETTATSTKSTTKTSETTVSKDGTVATYAVTPVTENESTTIWWTPTQTVWWTPDTTTQTTETTQNAQAADDTTTSAQTSTITTTDSDGKATTLTTTHSSSAKTSGSDILGSIDNGSTRLTPLYIFALPLLAVFAF